MARALALALLLIAGVACANSAAPASAASASATATVAATAAPLAAATPTPIACSGTATPAQTEGPYFKAGSPERTTLSGPGIPGSALTVTGHVLGLDCQPIAGATLDFWQANGNGQYDNAGYTLRGHQTTDAAGAFHLETVLPGEYPGRTQHIHVKVQRPGGAILTTQLYFPASPRNSQDPIFDPALLTKVSADGSTATFDFVLGA
jgi:protocatechuate 3,4-dioxygenase beta subunit